MSRRSSLRLRPSVTAPRRLARAAWLSTTLVGAAGPGLAQGSCGAPVMGVVICDGAGNPYPAGIAYDLDAALTLILTPQARVEGPVSLKAYGLVVVNDGSIDVTGGAAALALNATQDARLQSRGDIASHGDEVPGLSVVAAGPITLDASRVLTSGWRSAGVTVSGGGSVDLRLGQIEVRGVLSRAVEIAAAGHVQLFADRLTSSGDAGQALVIKAGAVDIVVEAAEVTSGLDRAIDVQTTGPARLALGSVRAPNGGLDAVFVHASDGDVTVSAGRVETNGDQSRAIGAQAPHGQAVTVVDTIVTTGDDAVGLSVAGADATAVVTNLVSTQGRRRLLTTADGVQVQASGRGPLDGHAVAIVQSIRATGADARALRLDATRLASVQLHGEVSAPQGEALHLTAPDAEVWIATGAVVAGRVAMTSKVSGALRLVNNGTLVGPDAIIATGDGDGLYENRGLVRGRVSLGSGDDAFTNIGLAVIDGDWDLGSGRDQIINTGTMRLATRGADTRIAAVEDFQNGGLIDLTGGAERRRLLVDGAYLGQARSRLAVDLAADGHDGQADQLVIAGPATGRTEVLVNHLQGGLGLLGKAAIVTVGAGSDPGAFVLAPVTPRGGLVEEQLVFEPRARQFILRGLPSARALQVTAAIAHDELDWQETARDFWAARASTDEAASDGQSSWLTGDLTSSRAEGRVDYTAFGQRVSQSLSVDEHRYRVSGGIERVFSGKVATRLAVSGSATWREQGRAAGAPASWAIGLELGGKTQAGFADLSIGLRSSQTNQVATGPILQNRSILPAAQAVLGRYVQTGRWKLIPWTGLAVTSAPRVTAITADVRFASKADAFVAGGLGLLVEPWAGPEIQSLRPFVEVSLLRRLTPGPAATLSEGPSQVKLNTRLEGGGPAIRSGLVWRAAPRAQVAVEGALRSGAASSLAVSATLRF